MSVVPDTESEPSALLPPTMPSNSALPANVRPRLPVLLIVLANLINVEFVCTVAALASVTGPRKVIVPVLAPRVSKLPFKLNVVPLVLLKAILLVAFSVTLLPEVV